MTPLGLWGVGASEPGPPSRGTTTFAVLPALDDARRFTGQYRCKVAGVEVDRGTLVAKLRRYPHLRDWADEIAAASAAQFLRPTAPAP